MVVFFRSFSCREISNCYVFFTLKSSFLKSTCQAKLNITDSSNRQIKTSTNPPKPSLLSLRCCNENSNWKCILTAFSLNVTCVNCKLSKDLRNFILDRINCSGFQKICIYLPLKNCWWLGARSSLSSFLPLWWRWLALQSTLDRCSKRLICSHK